MNSIISVHSQEQTNPKPTLEVQIENTELLESFGDYEEQALLTLFTSKAFVRKERREEKIIREHPAKLISLSKIYRDGK